MDKLKEIRDKYKGYGTYFENEIAEIQQTSYNLGKHEAIEKIEIFIDRNVYTDEDGNNLVDAEKLNDLLTSLKENKK